MKSKALKFECGCTVRVWHTKGTIAVNIDTCLDHIKSIVYRAADQDPKGAKRGQD